MGYIKPEKVTSKDKTVFHLRIAKPEDAGAMISLNREIMAESLYAIHEADEYNPVLKNEKERFRKFGDAEGKIIILAFSSNELAGYVSFNNWDTRKTMHTGFLTIYIKKPFRSKGLGKILMKRLIGWGKKNKIIKKMSLAVFATNVYAIELYKKLGFKIEGVCPKDIKIKGRYVDSIFMYKFMN